MSKVLYNVVVGNTNKSFIMPWLISTCHTPHVGVMTPTYLSTIWFEELLA